MFEVNRNPSPKTVREFGRAMVLGFGVLAALCWTLHWWRHSPPSFWSWTDGRGQLLAIGLFLVGLVLFAIATATPKLGARVYVAWMSAAVPVGMVMSTLMLSVLFFVLLPVFSLIVRRGDPLRTKLTDDPSYWEDYKPYEHSLERMKRPF